MPASRKMALIPILEGKSPRGAALAPARAEPVAALT
jgi:hypothetical protein